MLNKSIEQEVTEIPNCFNAFRGLPPPFGEDEAPAQILTGLVIMHMCTPDHQRLQFSIIGDD